MPCVLGPVNGGDGNDGLVGNFASDLLLGGRGDDVLNGDAPGGPPESGELDVCIGQDGTDLTFPDTSEQEIQTEGDFVPSPEEG